MRQAYRRPVQDRDVECFDAVIQNALKSGYNFTDAMIAGYTAVLSSPAFLYLHEQAGRLDDLALAERLSYFLWNSTPDAELRRLAEQGKLHRPEVLSRQTDRLLNDPRSQRFVNAFLDYWLDMRLISGTAPDAELYPDYQLDDLLVESMTGETEAILLMSSDAAEPGGDEPRGFRFCHAQRAFGGPLRHSWNCRRGFAPRDFAERQPARRLDDAGQRAQSHRQRNHHFAGKTRGLGFMARLLGQAVPAAIFAARRACQAIEPDIRGATTIREQLAKHRNQESCAVCHRKIDPAGFALENFDVMGAFRDHYRSTGAGPRVQGVGHNGLTFQFCTGPAVDPSGELPDGETFRDVRELKQELLKDKEQLARNLAQQLTVYATGAPIGFSDRPQIAKMLAQSRSTDYGVRTLIHQVVLSDLFLNK